MGVQVIRTDGGIEAMVSTLVNDERYVIGWLKVADTTKFSEALLEQMGGVVIETVRERIEKGAEPELAMEEELAKAERVIARVVAAPATHLGLT